jgi:hypothetical protein
MTYPFMTLLLVLFMTHTQAQEANKETTGNFNKLSWLTGTWNRTNVKPGRKAHERWELAGTLQMKGFGVSMKEKDTLFVEKIQLLVKDNHIWYVADVPQNKEPVYFKLTAITNDGFTCENPAHDFPKKIEYKLDGNKLRATISGDGKAIDYLFERQ